MSAVGREPLGLEWFDLQKHAKVKLKQERTRAVPPGEWDNLLMRFRKLREALTAAAAPVQLKCEVYELSADVCAAADNMAELLKCLQQLVNNIYPALERQQQQQQQQQEQPVGASTEANPPHISSGGEHYDSSSGSHLQSAWSDTDSSDGSGDNTPGSNAAAAGSSSSSIRVLQRYPEVAAALLLYFVCIPRRPVIQEITKQLRSAGKPRQGNPALISYPVYQQAVADTAAALRCMWCHFLGSFYGQQQPPRVVRAVMRHAVERMRVQAVFRLGIAYRMLPTAEFQRWLWLQHSSSSNSSCGGGNGSSSTGTGSAATTAAAAGVTPEALQQGAYGCVVSLLQQAAAEGSKAASIAAARCVEEGSLPATLHFRV